MHSRLVLKKILANRLEPYRHKYYKRKPAMTEEEAFQNWFKEHWRYSSSTDEGLARKAWIAARDAYITTLFLDDLRIDPKRASTEEGLRTGIFVRAKDQSGKYQTVDIALLDGLSLLAWLRSRGGRNFWAENTLGRLLGHKDLSQYGVKHEQPPPH
jgi:hypothetical protein